jgi:uncharacterized protein YaaR (DUF327 family)
MKVNRSGVEEVNLKIYESNKQVTEVPELFENSVDYWHLQEYIYFQRMKLKSLQSQLQEKKNHLKVQKTPNSSYSWRIPK